MRMKPAFVNRQDRIIHTHVQDIFESVSSLVKNVISDATCSFTECVIVGGAMRVRRVQVCITRVLYVCIYIYYICMHVYVAPCALGESSYV